MPHWRVIYEIKHSGVLRTRALPERYHSREEAQLAADELQACGFDCGVVFRGRDTERDLRFLKGDEYENR